MSNIDTETLITTIDLLRHGQCVDGQYYRGRTDVALSSEGANTMQQRVSHVLQGRQPPWQTIVTSPLIRCAVFAEELASRYQVPLQKEAALQEMSFGDWEGKSIENVWQTQQTQVEQWYQDPVRYPPPNGEAADKLAERVQACLLSLIQQHQGQHILCVIHGGVIRVILSHCLAVPLQEMHRFDVPYACFSRLQIFTSTQDDALYYRLMAHNMASEMDAE